jgi:hypothetical protein
MERSAKRSKRTAAPSGSESDALQAMVKWYTKYGGSTEGMEIRPHASGGHGLFCTRKFRPGEAIGFLPKALILDPVAMLATDETALKARQLGGTEPFSFWLSLAAASLDSSHMFHAYLSSLPREGPDPTSWPESDRALLSGTPLAKHIVSQRRLLSDEFSRIAPKAAPAGVTFEHVVWARGVHLSRCFPRALVEAAELTDAHEIVASDAVEANFTMEHGGDGPARVTWTDENQSAPSSATTEAATNKASSAQRQDEGSSSAVSSSRSGVETNNTDGGHSADLGDAGEDDGVPAYAANLGVLLPFLDMADHQGGQPIGWEAGAGGVRFRCRTHISRGGQLLNNYGPKGNTELLWTYGFAIDSNPFDVVEGVVVGCRPTGDPELTSERTRLLEEHGVGYKMRQDGALLIGPFDIMIPKPEPDGEGQLKNQEGDEGEEDEGGNGGVIPAELLFALQVVGMESTDEGPCLTLDELQLLEQTLTARIAPLLPSEADDSHAEAHTHAGYVAAYRDGQRRILRAALAELTAMAEAAAGEPEGDE